MAKLSYFDEGVAAADDRLLLEAIEAGVVPATCLLGGVVVREEHDADHDPCTTCFGPRAICKGRPRIGSSDITSALDNRGDSSDFRRRERQAAREALDDIFRGPSGGSS